MCAAAVGRCSFSSSPGSLALVMERLLCPETLQIIQSFFVMISVEPNAEMAVYTIKDGINTNLHKLYSQVLFFKSSYANKACSGVKKTNFLPVWI